MSCQCGHHSQTSAHVDLAIDNNGTWSDAFQFGTPGDTTWSFTGCSFAMDVTRNRYDAVKLLIMTTVNGRIVVDDVVQRVLHFLVTPSDLQAALPPGEYVYDLVLTDPTGVKVPLMHGKVCVNQGVTYP